MSSGTSARAARDERSARPDVDRVKASKLASELVLTADQKQLVGVGVLRAEAMLAGQNAPPQRDPADRDWAPLPQRWQFLVGASVVLPNPRVAPEQIFGAPKSERLKQFIRNIG